jgi:hypothetical protein
MPVNISTFQLLTLISFTVPELHKVMIYGNNQVTLIPELKLIVDQ